MAYLEQPHLLRAQYMNALLHDIIPFWMKYSPDWEAGGYFTCLDRDGSVYDTDKFVWLQGRQVWMFSKFYNELDRHSEFLRMAELGARFLADHGHDARGDFYFALDRSGTPLVQPYSIFSDCFAAMAFAEFNRASGLPWAGELAVKTFERILARWENPAGQYNKKVPGSRPMRSMVLPMITVNLAQEVGKALPDYPVAQVIRDNVRDIVETFIDREKRLIFEHVAADGSHPDTFEGRLINPGHGIECTWFLMAASEALGDPNIATVAVDALEDQLAFGWDEEFGGIYYFRDALGKPPRQLEWDQKLWWVHIETLIALIYGYLLTGRESLSRWYDRVHDYTWSHFPDAECGEWYGYLNRRGEVLLPCKGGVWKGCFHIPRGLLMCTRLLERLSSKSAS